jgi:type VI secretion system secreted protein VgrG
MAVTFSQANFPIVLSSPLGKDCLQVQRIQGQEELMKPFCYEMDLRSEDRAVNFSSVIGQPVTVAFSLSSGEPRYLSGIVSRFRQGGTDSRFTHYWAELRPWVWLLSLTRDCRIFQNQTIPDIITTVFADFGLTDFRNELKSQYDTHEYCVQYQETAFDFVSRLMEEEGIFYFFKHYENRHELILADDMDAHPSCPGSSTVTYRRARKGHREDSVVSQCTLEEQMVPGGFATDDFNFTAPSTNLLVHVPGNDKTRIWYDYPGRFSTTTAGEVLARRRLEAVEAPGRLLRGEGTCRGFIAGHRFCLDGHDRQDVNGAYVIGRLVLTATQERYENSFEAFPAAVPFRPLPAIPRPAIPGSQTAMVVGKKGEEIWTDQYGRIKVQFHWDQRGAFDEKSSCWVRVAQGWAGKQWGAQFLPRIGQEVIVSFLDGDPDRPLVTGTVYNAEHMPPFPLPQHQTQSGIRSRTTKGGGVTDGNEIRFEDANGQEEFFVQAQKDMKLMVKHDRTTTVSNDETVTVTHNRTVTIEEGEESLVVCQGDRAITVKKGKETHSVQGTREVTVAADETHVNKQNFTQNVSGDHVLKVTGNLTIDVSGSVTIKAGQSVTTKAGMSLTNQAGTSLTNKAGTSLTNEAEVSMTNKAGASQTVDGGGMLTVKGGIVQIN